MTDIYTTRVLNRVVDDLPRMGKALLQMFFPFEIVEESEEIHFDKIENAERLAPFVSPLVQGKVVQDKGFKTRSFKPAYIKDKRVHNPQKALRRRAGERLNGGMSAEARARMNLASSLSDQMVMLENRLEVMASEILRTGKVIIDGDGFDMVEVNFGRDAGLTIGLTGAAEWGASGVSPLDDVKDWSRLVFSKSGAAVTDVVMDPKAAELFLADSKVQTLLDSRRGSGSTAEMGPRINRPDLIFIGRIGELNFWEYQAHYTDGAGVQQQVLPDNTVLMGSPLLEGTQQFGAIHDQEAIEAGLTARREFVKSWVEKDPSVRYLLMQSAPLVVPYRPDACLSATVIEP